MFISNLQVSYKLTLWDEKSMCVFIIDAIKYISKWFNIWTFDYEMVFQFLIQQIIIQP